MADTPKKDKMTKTKWGILIAIIVIIDIVQIVLDFFVVGLGVNRIIDIVVAALLLLIFKIQRVHLNMKQFLSICAVFGAEIIPVVDGLPLWTADILWIYGQKKAEEALAKLGPIGAAAKVAIEAKEGNVEAIEEDMAGRAGNISQSVTPATHNFPLSSAETNSALGASGGAIPPMVNGYSDFKTVSNPQNVIDLRGKLKDPVIGTANDIFNAESDKPGREEEKAPTEETA